MSDTQSIQDIIEDHALEHVPDGERHGWLAFIVSLSLYPLLYRLLYQDKLS